MTTERRFAMSKVGEGDWLCWSNDVETIWRFQRYEDGAALGLDVSYHTRTFWRALYLPSPIDLDRDHLDDYPWREAAQWLPTRKAAVNVMLARGEA